MSQDIRTVLKHEPPRLLASTLIFRVSAELIRMSLQSQHVSCSTRSFAVLVRSPRLPHDALLTNPSRFSKIYEVILQGTASEYSTNVQNIPIDSQGFPRCFSTNSSKTIPPSSCEFHMNSLHIPLPKRRHNSTVHQKTRHSSQPPLADRPLQPDPTS